MDASLETQYKYQTRRKKSLRPANEDDVRDLEEQGDHDQERGCDGTPLRKSSLCSSRARLRGLVLDEFWSVWLVVAINQSEMSV